MSSTEQIKAVQESMGRSKAGRDQAERGSVRDGDQGHSQPNRLSGHGGRAVPVIAREVQGTTSAKQRLLNKLIQVNYQCCRRNSFSEELSSGMLRRVALVRTDVSKEHSASFIRVTKIGELGTTLAATSFFAACVGC
jgi:hypothetical protein